MHKTEILAVSTGFAGCLMMALAFVYIIIYGSAVMIEPNWVLSRLELGIFAAGGLANMFAALKLLRR